MNVTQRIHDGYVHNRRVRRLTDLISALIPQDVSVLDVGSGDGQLARQVLDRRPDLTISGIDVLVRQDTAIPVEPFDGDSIPKLGSSRRLWLIVVCAQ